MARKFLYLIAGVTLALLLLMVALRVWSDDLTEMAFVPSVSFTPQSAMVSSAWDDPAMWVSRPGLKNDPASWLPPGVTPPAQKLPVAVFFIHPTSYIARDAWNASLGDKTSRDRAALFVQGMASPFNGAEALWAPRYRQSAVGAFLTAKPEATQAIDLAYRDVLAAFEVFTRSLPEGRPFALAGHSQGAFLLRRLLRDRVAGTPLADRLVGAWVIGWPVSLDHDLPRMGVPACERADQAGCVVSWLTVADPADTEMLMRAYGRRTGLDGQSVAGSAFLCTNPLTGTSNAGSDASANLGTLVPDFKAGGGTLAPAVVPAACGPDHFLHIGEPPKLDMGPYVLPGNNYHLYDVTLFWANLRADFERRVAAWQKAHNPPK
ncbi:DUF3089 domain-containing protein [Novosphingobium sp. AP12]|uniref:DUF3089 domain-containing protein n=1 Tax=Novosphingobium sp. AP12 TaxID=1144305 RepID=UPI0002721F37|nr:DUF3089 domain-containing protein [Novosphingobium sp. AP12]EJL23724.1 Protein of unknown function (DUF3089) [Novosphingobium sp. AP12]